MSDGNGFAQFKLMLIDRLEKGEIERKELLSEIRELREKEIPRLERHILELKIKASLWGGVAGVVPAAIAAVVWYISQ